VVCFCGSNYAPRDPLRKRCSNFKRDPHIPQEPLKPGRHAHKWDGLLLTGTDARLSGVGSRKWEDDRAHGIRIRLTGTNVPTSDDLNAVAEIIFTSHEIPCHSESA
jgi:hypothetical protein